MNKSEHAMLDANARAERSRTGVFAQEQRDCSRTCSERGNRLELDWLSGKVVALGSELGVPTPANLFAYRALKLWRTGGGVISVSGAAT